MTVRAVGEILARFRDMRLEPGRAFTENELVEELNVGKTPVREALLILGAQNYVIPRPRSGYRVSPITVRDVRNLFSVLRPLTAEAAASAARRGVDKRVLLLAEDLQLTMEPDAAPGPEAGTAILHLFGIVAAESGNARLYRALAQLLHDVTRVVNLVMRTASTRSLPSATLLISALAGDPGDADAAWDAAWTLVEEWTEFVVGELLESDALLTVDVAVPNNGDTPRPRGRGRASSGAAAKQAKQAKATKATKGSKAVAASKTSKAPSRKKATASGTAAKAVKAAKRTAASRQPRR
jgi:DNA-binding GntR family transcriptional regulator